MYVADGLSSHIQDQGIDQGDVIPHTGLTGHLGEGKTGTNNQYRCLGMIMNELRFTLVFDL